MEILKAKPLPDMEDLTGMENDEFTEEEIEDLEEDLENEEDND